MRKLLSVFAMVLVAVLLSSCTSTIYSSRQAWIPEKDLLVMPTVVDIEVDMENKVEATSNRVEGVDNAINNAYYKALEKSGADVIVDPVYKVETTGFGRFGGKSIATITGFTGKYVNARELPEAMKELESVTLDDAEKALLLLYGTGNSGADQHTKRGFGSLFRK